jgi:hypothetical protein
MCVFHLNLVLICISTMTSIIKQSWKKEGGLIKFYLMWNSDRFFMLLCDKFQIYVETKLCGLTNLLVPYKTGYKNAQEES